MVSKVETASATALCNEHCFAFRAAATAFQPPVYVYWSIQPAFLFSKRNAELIVRIGVYNYKATFRLPACIGWAFMGVFGFGQQSRVLVPW
jgi:hypothetical protein